MARTIIAALVAALVVMAGPARAADDEGEGGSGGAVKTERGVYATLGGLAALDAFTDADIANGQTAWGLDTRVGYRIFPWLAGEAQYQFIPDQRVDVAGPGSFDLTTHALTANGKIYVFNGPLQPYLLLGFGFVDMHAKGDGTDDSNLEAALRAGAGLQVLFTEHIGVYGEVTYLKPFGTLEDLNEVPIAFGGVYQF